MGILQKKPMKDLLISIYSLDCPIDKIPKYIGQSITPNTRLREHIYKAKKSTNTKKKAWIKGLLYLNLKPLMVILDTVFLEEADFWERYYINLYKSWGFVLYNLTSGGEIKKVVSQSTKDKLRNINLGKKVSQETKEKMSISGLGKVVSVETRKKMSLKQLGKNTIQALAIDCEHMPRSLLF